MKARFAGCEIRLGLAQDGEAIRQFIHEHWRPSHALVESTALFDWQHKDPRTGSYHFVLAQKEESREIVGLLGYIPTSQFDPLLESENDLWLAIWKVTSQAPSGLGLWLILYLRDTLKPRSLGIVGMTEAAAPIHRKLFPDLGTLDHWFRPNPDVSDFHLLHFPEDKNGVTPTLTRSTRFEKITAETFGRYEAQLEALCALPRSPRKTPRYFERRYLEHPIYDYELYAAFRGSRLIGLAVIRQAEHQGRKALRMVDLLIGDLESSFPGELADELFESSGAEYIDFYCHGIEAQYLRRCGFLNRSDYPGAIVPSHFEPFECTNQEMRFAYRCEGSPQRPYVIVRADADQDRPSQMPTGRTKNFEKEETCQLIELR
jgi:hypothetical protein